MIRFRPIAQFRYQERLPRLGVSHGQDFDCSREGCSVCQPHRDLEKAYWDTLTNEQKHETRFFKWGI